MNPIQLFDEESCTYTYLLVDPGSKESIIIDPVDSKMERDLAVIRREGLMLKWIVETHAHADHITSAAQMAELTGAKIAAPKACEIGTATWQLEDQQELQFGTQVLRSLSTPGHTAGSMSFVWAGNVFTGDTLLINGCGRTDFQSGSAQAMFHSLTHVLFSLSDQTVVWPGHDYNGKTSSTIAHEKLNNPRIAGKSLDEFVEIMSNLHLPKPKRIDEAVPANLKSGLRQDAHWSDAVQFQEALGYAGDVSNALAWGWVQEKQAILVDVRTKAELEWVGFVPGAVSIPWKDSPSMTMNPDFDAQLKSAVGTQKVLFLCRSGVRSIAAAKRATELGLDAYNIKDGFEGEMDEHAHRGSRGGWKQSGLPWRQN
jgi:glyoxylase-like metal-dependent hydrolase (beta-lactamase superfamily II)/rhodanese-related sulfurtransferase